MEEDSKKVEELKEEFKQKDAPHTSILHVRKRTDQNSLYASIPTETRDLFDVKDGDKLHILVFGKI
jgi:hypothetical protein